VTLLHELKEKFPSEIVPKHMSNGNYLPWVMPIYGQGAELELMDLLYCFVRLLRPFSVVDLGSNVGMSAYALGRGVEENGAGQVVTCDVDEQFVQMTINRVRDLSVKVCFLSADNLQEVETCDFIFCDSSYETRIRALERIKKGCVAIVHDVRQEPSLAEAVLKQPHRVLLTGSWRGIGIVVK